MPFTKRFGIEQTSLQIGIWQITETLEECVQLARDYRIPITHLSHPQRIRQYVSSRVLLMQQFPFLEPVFGTEKAAPRVKNPGISVSFSHTLHYSSLVLGEDVQAGIDMEFDKEKIFRVHERFCSEKELAYIFSNPMLSKEITCMLWCIKEAVFKKYHQRGLNFKQQILVPPFVPESENFIIPVVVQQGDKWVAEKCYLEKFFTHWLAVV